MGARWWWAESQRAGRGLAILDGTALSVGVYGTLPGPDQSVPRLELFAVCEALRLGLKTCHIRIDHLSITLGLEKGEEATTSPTYPNADLWKRLWHHLHAQRGLGDNLSIEWVPGHDEGPAINALGNRWADKMDKLGAKLHEVPAEILHTWWRSGRSCFRYYVGSGGRRHCIPVRICRPSGPPKRIGPHDQPWSGAIFTLCGLESS